jgi:hypothetical protein
MTREYSGFTAYSDDDKDCFGLVDVLSNMGDLSVYEVASNKPPYKAEIYFSGNDCLRLPPANPFRLTLRRNDERTGQAYETWKLIGQATAFPVNPLKISLSSVVHYIDGDEHIYWDVFKPIHRINGKDHMEETRKNLGME